jgi:hypothetical protein
MTGLSQMSNPIAAFVGSGRELAKTSQRLVQSATVKKTWSEAVVMMMMIW